MNGADVAWTLIATALVLLMTPALAFFYGGLVRLKNALNTMMMSVVALGVVGVGWAIVGYTLAFGAGNALIGDLSRALLRNVGLEPQGTIPHVLFMAYQGTFAIITAALIRRIVERMRVSVYGCRSWIVDDGRYAWSRTGCGGRLAREARRAGSRGTVAHVNAGVAALVAAIVLAAQGLRAPASSAQRPVHAPRRRAAVVRVVRVQRRLALGASNRRARVCDDDAGVGGDAGRVDAA